MLGLLQEFDDAALGEKRRAVMISEIEIKEFNPSTGAIFLDPNRNSPRTQEFAEDCAPSLSRRNRKSC